MSDVLGFERGIKYSNDNILRNSAIQGAVNRASIRQQNQYKNIVGEQKTIQAGVEKGLESAKAGRVESGAQHESGEFLGDVRNVYKSAKTFQKLGKTLQGHANTIDTEMGNYRNPIASGEAEEGEKATQEIFSSELLPEGWETTSKAISKVSAPATSIADTATRSAVGTASQAVEDLAPKATRGFADISGAMDSLGKAGEGLSVVSGIADTIDDATGKWSKMNNAERVGNVAGISSAVFGTGSLAGGLEMVGTALDATGIGAELGVAFNIAGAVAGGVSAISDYIGSEEKQKPQSGPLKKVASAPTPIPQQHANISTLQSGGVALSGYT
tara:strand:- start:1214 stop:2200 length:987 start_codon:yes stop_codon:yes gene_type:complete